MSFTLFHTFDPSSQSIAGDGWSDPQSKWSIVGGKLQPAATMSYNTDFLVRPSGENQQDQQTVLIVAPGQSVGVSLAPYHRLNPANGDGYFISWAAFDGPTGTIKFFANNNGGFAGQIGTNYQPPTNFDNGLYYRYTTSVTGTNPTTLTATLESSPDGTTWTAVGTVSNTDSTADLLQGSGSYGLTSLDSGVTTVPSITRVALYSAGTSASLSGVTVAADGGTALQQSETATVRFTGTSTTWNTTAPTITADVGTLGTLSVVDDTHATASYTAPASGTLATFTDATDGSTTATLALGPAPTGLTVALSPSGTSTGTLQAVTVTASSGSVLTGAQSVTLGDSGHAGIFTAVPSLAAHTLTPASSAASYLPAQAGTYNVTASVASPAVSGSASDTVTAGRVVVPISDPNLIVSPGWKQDGSAAFQASNIRSDATYAQTQFTGASQAIGHTGTSVHLIYGPTAGNSSLKIKTSTDASAYAESGLQKAGGELVLATGLSAGNHATDFLITFQDDNYDKWDGPANVLQVFAYTLDSGAATIAPGTAPLWPRPTGKALHLGTSQQQIGGNPWPGYPTPAPPYSDYDARLGWSRWAAKALDMELQVCGCSAQGLGRAANGSSPNWNVAGAPTNMPGGYEQGNAANTTWDKYDANTSRIVGGLYDVQYDLVLVDWFTNDNTTTIYATDGSLTTAIDNLKVEMRAAWPNARIVFLVPVGGYRRAAITAVTPLDSKMLVLDLDPTGLVLNPGLDGSRSEPTSRSDGTDGSGLHPNEVANMEIAALFVRAYMNWIQPYSTQSSGSGGRRRVW